MKPIMNADIKNRYELALRRAGNTNKNAAMVNLKRELGLRLQKELLILIITQKSLSTLSGESFAYLNFLSLDREIIFKGLKDMLKHKKSYALSHIPVLKNWDNWLFSFIDNQVLSIANDDKIITNKVTLSPLVHESWFVEVK